MKNLILKNKKVSVVVVIIIIAAIYFLFFKGDGEDFQYVIIERGELIQEVIVTGRVRPADSVDLAFEKTGRVRSIYVDIGEEVYAGQTLVVLENADQLAKLNQAKASLEIQKATLDELIKGSREEEIEIQEIKVENAKAAIFDSETILSDTVSDAFTRSDNSIRNNIDQFFTNPTGINPSFDLLIASGQLQISIENQRLQIESILNNWNENTAKDGLNEIKYFLNDIATAVNNAKATTEISQSTIDGYKTDVSTSRTSVNTAISNLTGAEEGYKDSLSTLRLEEQELILKIAGATPEQIRIQVARVSDAEASVLNYQALLGKTLISSPISGVITKQNVNIGEIVSSNSLVVSVISEAKFEIEADIPEADISKVDLEDKVEVTLDAYGEEVIFPAKITSIEPAETIIEGVPTYTTTLQFLENDNRIRSGMTANIDITTDTRENVISIPARAVITKNGDKFVRVIENGEMIDVTVLTGIRGSDGKIEILSGLKEGDKVITLLER